MSCGPTVNPCSELLLKALHGAVGLSKVALGVGLADAETVKQRLDRCRNCEHSTKNSAEKFKPFNGLTTWSQCRLCGCFVKAKTQLASERCPDAPAHWGRSQAPPDA